MTETEWLACDTFKELFRHLETTELLTQRRLRLFAVAYCQRVTLRLGDPVLENALKVAEQFADGLATGAELAAVHDAACEIEDEIDDEFKLLDDTEALRFGAWAVREATSPDDPDNHNGTLDMIDHTVAALAYASPSYPKGDHEAKVAFFQQVGVAEQRSLVALVRDIFGNPFRRVAFPPEWGAETVLALARAIYESRDFSVLPILADALEDAGCDSADILSHCRGPGPHVRGCWVVDLVLAKG
jgi:hypothetical protein